MVREGVDQIHKCLKEKQLWITVALDSEGTVGGGYHVEAIPTLVLIDKSGVVQSVHIGYNPAIGDASQKLDSLLAGKDLAKEARQEAKEAQKAEGLEPAWTVSGPSSGVAADPRGKTVYAVQNETPR